MGHLPLEEVPSLGEELHASDDRPCFGNKWRCIARKGGTLEKVEEGRDENGAREDGDAQHRVAEPKERLKCHVVGWTQDRRS